MFKSGLLGILFSALAVLCGIEGQLTAKRMQIFGGRTVTIREFGHQLQFVIQNQTICGACLISNVWAVTAAHCTDAFPTGIRLIGGSDVRGKGTQFPVLKVFQHPKYDPTTFENDISLLLFAPLVITNSLYPIKIPSIDQPIATGTVCQVSGFGLTEDGTQPWNLLGTDIKISDQPSCVKNYTLVSFAILPSMVCAGSLDRDSCSGDSVCLIS